MRRARAQAALGISSAIVLPVLRALEEAGADVPARLLEETSKPFVGGAAVDEALDAASERLQDPALGLSLARRIPIGALGLLDYALCTSASLRDALGTVARHYAVATQRVRLALIDESPHAALAFDRDPTVAHSRHWIEFSFGVMAERMRDTLGQPVVFSQVAFTHDAPPSRAAHDAFFGVEARFGQPRDVLGFSAELLALPLRTASGCLAQLLAERFREIEPTAEDPFAAHVRRAIVDLLDAGDCRLNSAAERVRVSARTLQRRLATLGTSHRDLLDDVRRERSLHLLRASELSVTQVAERLGFSETSAFFRAFRRWTGQSPQTFRRDRR